MRSGLLVRDAPDAEVVQLMPAKALLRARLTSLAWPGCRNRHRHDLQVA